MNMMLSGKRESGHKDLCAGSISVAQVGWLGGWMDRWMDTVGAEMKWNPLPVPLLERCAADPLHHRGNTDGWIERQTKEWMDKWADGWLDDYSQTDGWAGTIWKPIPMDMGVLQTLCVMKGGWIDGWIDGSMDWWRDRQMEWETNWQTSLDGIHEWRDGQMWIRDGQVDLWMRMNGGMDKWGEGWPDE